jgi:MYXO-CTERM domain-containing protein
MKKYLQVSFLVLCLGVNVHGQGVIIEVIGTPGTLITDCETGQPVGPGYVAAIYWGPGVTSDRRNFTQIGGTMNIINGRLFGGNRTLPGVTPGGTISIYAAAWQSALGFSYEIASQVPGARVGQSAIVSVVTSPITTTQVRIPDFQVCPVPEPSSAALGTLALAAFWLFRRKTPQAR